MKFTQEIFDNCKWIDDYVIRYKYVKYRIVKCRNCGVLCLIKRYKNVDGYCSYQCRNKKMSNEHKENLSKLLTGRKLSKKHVEKLIGRKYTEESKKKMSDAHIGRPSNRKGKKATDETKQKSRESHMGLLSGEKILCMVNIIQKKLKRK